MCCLYKVELRWLLAESVSIEENLVVTGSVCQYRTSTAYQ